MTKEEQDALLGKVVRENRETEEKINSLKIAIERIGSRLVELGQALLEEPETVNPLPPPEAKKDYREHLQALNSEKLKSLLKDLKELREKHGRLQRQYRQLMH